MSIHSVEFSNPNLFGASSLPLSTESFFNNTRIPGLFRTKISSIKSRKLYTDENSFQINFIFQINNKPDRDLLLGFSSAETISSLYTVQGLLNDTLNVSTEYEHKATYFYLNGAVRKHFRTQKWLRPYIGGGISLGIPVTARTFEKIYYDGYHSPRKSYKFYSSKHLSYNLSIPFGVQFRLFKNVYSGLHFMPTARIHTIDGNTNLMYMNTTYLNLNFKLRNK